MLPDANLLRHMPSSCGGIFVLFLAGGYDQRHVVGLVALAELLHVAEDGLQNLAGWLWWLSLNRRDQALFAVFFLVVWSGFGDSVGIDHQDVAGGKLAFLGGALPFFEQSQDRRGGLKALNPAIRSRENGSVVAAVHVAQSACRVIVDAEKHGGIVAGLRVAVEEKVDGAQQARHIL